MNEGVYRILSALSDGRTHARSAVVRDAGEAQSVLLALEKDKPRWFDAHGAELRLSEKGRKAHAFEQRARTPALSEAELVDALRARLDGRPAVKRELDQVFATPETVARRARRLVATGEAQRGVLFLGDDDLTSLALRLLLEAAGLEDRRVRVLELDEELVAFLRERGVEATRHDLREPIPKDLDGRFGCVFTDPPYAPEGFGLFLSRAVPALKNDGRVWVCFGQSRRASERGLHKQRLLAEIGLLVEEVVPDFSRYEGAESIGARSALWVTRRTPMTRPLSYAG
ncbi:MAG TPA: bis-aminopropyl spermidine synthase family protein, partial [Polyangiaceae bacterium LLY-WYZ-15_(1-7)]|nr:bis-aminopropyl spermidine synthase family protein [Polyangiaceae bacterium LLY-WYZ-15_(1-7)]